MNSRLAALTLAAATAVTSIRAQYIVQMLPAQPDAPAHTAPRVPAPPPVRSVITPVLGESLSVEYFFDHNALLHAVRAGRSLVATTASANLITFDLATLAMTGEVVVAGGARALAPLDDEHVLVGTDDGRIDKLDIRTWKASHVAAASGGVVWLAMSPQGVVAVIRQPRQELWWPGQSIEDHYKRQEEVEAAAHQQDAILVIAGGRRRTFALGGKAIDIDRAAFALDATRGLWIGTDFGEFGGNLRRIDLVTGASRQTKSAENVRGFVRGPDGALYAHGGTSHFWISNGYVSRLGPGEPTPVAQFNNDAPARVTRPSGPIDHMIPTADGSGFWAVSDHGLYRVDRAMHDWAMTASFGGRWFGGAAFAIANTATVSTIVTDPGAPGEVIGVMGRDGLVRVTKLGESKSIFDGQLEGDVNDIWPTSAGTLLLPSTREAPSSFRRGPKGWDGGFFDGVDAAATAGWHGCTIAGEDGIGIVTACEAPITPGERGLIRVRRDGSTDVLDRWQGDDYFYRGLLTTPTGLPLDAGSDDLRARDHGTWHAAGKNLLADDMDTMHDLVQRRFRPLNVIGGILYLFDAWRGSLVALTPKPAGTYELAPVAAFKGRDTQIWDAIPDAYESFVLASHRGLIRTWLPDGRSRDLTRPGHGEEIVTVARDKFNWLWAGGDAVYLSTDEGTTWMTVDLPMVTRGSVKKIRANPETDSGVWISLGARGFLVLK